MVKRMLIDASHPDETRVVVLNGTRLEEFDYESASRKQLKGNIYLAKVTRVEPSLQAAFVEYGGNRHGFLPFSEIHPDYYRIPIADRQALLAEEARISRDVAESEPEAAAEAGNGAEQPDADMAGAAADEAGDGESGGAEPGEEGEPAIGTQLRQVEVESAVDTVGGDDVEDAARRRAKLLRRYKIQEVIKRRQVILVQVTKEERGNKGAALTTYLSLAGRYCVLMPNTGRGGGISRKIGSATDRRRLKQVVSDLDIPDGMAVIVRTAGSERSKVEIRRDYEYLMRLWNQIRENTLQSTAPAVIHEEANLIMRAIRDLYNRDTEEILVQGDDGYRMAKDFMKNLTPSHARKVKLYKDDTVPLFHRFKVESQIDAMHSPSVQLKSGGYIVINPTEALVAIDVNSGKATRERHIEETALRTNIEAGEEVARQLRLRDLAGLIVIDFIDMEESRHNRDVERRFKDAMRHDRARIQLGRISPFGLLEMSRQRLRPSIFESATQMCELCAGTGYIRTDESACHQALRTLEEDAIRRGGGEIMLSLPTPVALFLLNERRTRLVEIEQRHGLAIRVGRDDKLVAPEFKLERLSSVPSTHAAAVYEADTETEDEDVRESAPAEEEPSRRRRGRRRRRRHDDEAPLAAGRSAPAHAEADEEQDEAEVSTAEARPEMEDGEGERSRPRRRRSRRGGRRRSKRRDEPLGEGQTAESAERAAEPGYDEAAPQEAVASEETLADAAAEQPAEMEVADSEGPEPEATDAPAADKKAKPRRSRRRSRRVADPEAIAQGVTPEAEAEDPDAAEVAQADGVEPEAAADAEAAAPARRARTRRPRQRAKASKPAEAKSAPSNGDGRASESTTSEPVATKAASTETPPAHARPKPTEPERAVSAPATKPPSLEPAVSQAEGPDSDDGPKRRGWWQRWV